MKTGELKPVTLEAIQSHARIWWRRKGTFDQRGKGAWWGNYSSKVGFVPFYDTLSLSAPKETKRQLLRTFYGSRPCSSLPFPQLVESVSRTSRVRTGSPVMLEWVMGSFLGSLELPTDKMSNNCCNSAGCWHCSCASAELKHPEVSFSYFIWVYSYNHKGSIFIPGQYRLHSERCFWGAFREALPGSPCVQTPTAAEGLRREQLHRWPAWAHGGQVHCEFSLAAVENTYAGDSTSLDF